MGLSRSTFYDPSPASTALGDVLTRIGAICDEFECYGYRRVGAALRHQGVVVNGKRLRRLMREHDLHPPMAFHRLRRRNLGHLRQSDGGVTWSRPTATMPGRFIPTWPRTSFPTAPISYGRSRPRFLARSAWKVGVGGGPDLRRDPGRLRLPGRHPRRLVAQGRRLCDQPVDGRPHRGCCVEGGDPKPQPAQRMHSSFGSRFAVCVRNLSCAAARPWIGRLDEPPRQPV